MSFEIQNTAEMPHFEDQKYEPSQEEAAVRNHIKEQLGKGLCIHCNEKIDHLGEGTCEAHVGKPVPFDVNIGALAAQFKYEENHPEKAAIIHEFPSQGTEQDDIRKAA